MQAKQGLSFSWKETTISFPLISVAEIVGRFYATIGILATFIQR